jgi:hypothetical protein
MQDKLTARQSEVDGWEHQSEQQVYLSVAVGILGLLVSALQGSARTWTKALTVGVGFLISALTLLTNKVYTADYRTLERSVVQARPILEHLQGIILKFDPSQTPQNMLAVEAEFDTTCNKIDLIAQKMLGIDSGQIQSGRVFRFVPVVYAAQPQGPPGWTATKIQSDKTNAYIVGQGESKSLYEAKAASEDDAMNKAVEWLGSDVSRTQSPATAPLMDLVKHSKEFTDTWFGYDRQTGIYHYYTRLRLASDLRSLDFTSLAAPGLTNPIFVTLPNDTAVQVAATGLTLLLKHMGAIPLSADVYILSGRPDSGHKIAPYSHDRPTGEKYVTWIKTALKGCDGKSAEIGGYTVWCFHVDDLKIKEKTAKTQTLGTVSANGRQFNILATDFKSDGHSIEIEVRNAD